MAVYQGARLRTDRLSATGASARRARVSASAPTATAPGGARVRPIGALMAIIVAATMLGLVYLTQTLGSAATSTDIYKTEKASQQNWTTTQTLQISIAKATDADNIGPKARKQGLERLGDPIVLPAP